MRALLFLAALASVAQSAWAGGFVRAVEENGVCWLVDPDGKRLFSRGVDGVNPGVALADYDQANPAYCGLRLYPSVEKWRQAAAERLEKWGFNTAGGGSDRGVAAAGTKLYYAVTLNLGAAAGVPWADPDTPSARERYRKLLAPYADAKNDPRLIGYFLDNELGWWDETLLVFAVKQAWKNPLKKRVFEMLGTEYGGDLTRFLADFEVEPKPAKFEDLKGSLRRVEFRPGARPMLVERYAEWLADRYYRAACEEVRAVDSNHLILGDRYANFYSQPVVRAAARHVDVISTNYNTLVPQGWAAPFYFEGLRRISRKPVLVSEFYFASMQNTTKCGNRNGEYMVVATQKERAEGARRLAEGLERYPGVVGWHWFQFYDEPAGGRDPGGGGEDFNMGVVDVKDQAYTELVGALDRAGRSAEKLHGTWPAGAGLVRSPEGWRVPQLQVLPVVDGAADEWPMDKTWLPEARGAAPFERFGDVHLAWHPEGLVILVVYMDYRDRMAAPGRPEADTERLTIGVGGEDEAPVVLTLKGVMERRDPKKPAAGFYPPEVLTVRGGVPFPAEGRLLVAQKIRGTVGTVEIFMPAALFKREKLVPGTAMRMTVSLRLRANCREMFWPRTFRVTDFADGREWAPLLLEGGQ